MSVAFTLTLSVVTDSAGVPRIQIEVEYDPPATVGVFDGVSVFVQYPSGDVSPSQTFTYDGNPAGVGSARYGHCKALFPPPTSTQNWRVYVVSHSASYETPLVLHPDADESPNEVISVAAVTPIVVQIPGDVQAIGPNAFTLSVSLLTADGNGDRYQRFSFTYNPPTPITPFIGVSAYVQTPDGRVQFLGDYQYNGDGSGSTPGRYGTFTRDLQPANTAGETWTFFLVPRSVNYTAQLNLSTTPHVSITALSYSGGLLPALPAAIGGVVGAQASVAPIFRQLGTSDLLETRIQVTVNLPAGHTATGATIWIQTDGVNWAEVGNFPLDNDTQTIVDFWWTAPLATTGWKVKAITYGGGGWNDPNSAVQSNSFGVNAAATLAANIITNAAQSGAITYAQAADGQYYWGFQATLTNPDKTAQPYWWLTKFYVRKVDSGGNAAADPEGNLREIAEFDRAGVPITLSIADNWTIPPAGSGYKFRIYVYVVDLLGFEVLQTTAWSGQPYLELTPVQQVGSAGAEYAPAIGLGSFTGTAPTGFFGEDGAQMYYFTMRLTPPTAAAYQGFKGYAAPRGVVSAVNGSGTYNRVSGPYFNTGQIGQKVDISGVIVTIATVPSATQFTGTVWTGGSGSGVSVMLGEARQVIVGGRDDTAASSPKYPIQHVSEDFRLYALSMDYAGRTNSYRAGVTPIVDVTVSRSSGGAGKEWTDVVTSVSPETNDFTGQGLSISNCIALLLDSGLLQYIVSGTYFDPVDPATGTTRADFGGVKILRLNASDPTKSIEVADVGKSIQKFRSDFQPSGAGSLTFIFLSYDTSGRMNQYQLGTTPTFTAVTPAQTNTLNLARALTGSLTAAPFASNIRPIALVAALPSLPDPTNYPVGSEAYVTPSGPKYRVTPGGSAWELAVRGQDIVADTITAIQIATGAIGASEIATGDLLVGGLGKLNSRLVVKDLSNNIVVAMGDFGGVQMFHAINARIGPNVNAPFFYADGSQIAMGANALGFASVSITSGGVNLQNCLFSLTASDGTTTTINNSSLGGGFRGFALYNSIGQSAVVITPGSIQILDNVSTGTKFSVTAATGSNCALAMYNASNQQSFRITINSSGNYPTIILQNGAGGVKGALGSAAPQTITFVKNIIGGVPVFGTLELTCGLGTATT